MHAASATIDAETPGAAEAFDPQGGSLLERAVFNHRRTVIVVCAIVTVLLAALAIARLSLGASFEKMIPRSHPYIQNYLENRAELRGLGNALRIVVENPNGDIYDPKYENTLKKIHDEVFLTPGVDRAWVKSLWAPGVRWTEVTEEGFRGGPVMPDNYNGSPTATDQLRLNIARSGLVGSLSATTSSRPCWSCRCSTSIPPPASASTTAPSRTRSRRSATASRPTAARAST